MQTLYVVRAFLQWEMKSWTIKSKLQLRFSTKWPLWLPDHKSCKGDIHLRAEGQRCTTDKFPSASFFLRTQRGIQIHSSFCEPADARKPNSCHVVDKKPKPEPLQQPGGDAACMSPLPPGSIPDQADPVVTYMTHVRYSGKGI